MGFRAPSYKKAQSSSRSMSPKKFVARIKTISNEAISKRQSPSPPKLICSDQQYKSTIRIPSTSCESLAKPRRRSRRQPSPSSSLPMSSVDSLSSSSDESDSHCSNRKFAHSMPSVAAFGLRKMENHEVCSKVRMRHNRNSNTKNSAYRHTIRIGDEKVEEIFNK